jgi:omega-6 fatty acid desaturase (delta-12 desaturase)
MANLEKRGVGDIWLMTLSEYRNAGTWERLRYRLYRNPFFMLFVSAPVLFLIVNRVPSKGFRKRELLSVLFTDLVLVMLLSFGSAFIGWKGLLLILLPMMLGASMLGLWLFYVQHQFRRVYWAHNGEWDRFRAAMEGSSLYLMPSILRWLSGNIGYHHIHHLAPRIPNYRLKECFDEIPELQEIDPVPYLSGLRNICLSLWDEKSGLLVSFREAIEIIEQRQAE